MSDVLCDDDACECCHPEMMCRHRMEPFPPPGVGLSWTCPDCGAVQESYRWSMVKEPSYHVEFLRRHGQLAAVEGTLQWREVSPATIQGPYK